MRVWNLGVIVFLVFFATLIALNVYISGVVQPDFETQVAVPAVFQPKKINKDLLNKVYADIQKRKEIFESSLLKGPELRDISNLLATTTFP